MITLLYNVISSNGYITEKNSSEDFIPNEVWDIFIELCKNYSVLVMGRKTYESIQKYDKKALEQLEDLTIKKIVVSRDKNFKIKDSYTTITSPEYLPTDEKILLSSGPSLNTACLKLGLIENILLHVLPVNISGGLKVFDDNVSPSLLLVHEEKYPDGRKLCFYQIN